jgi:hypothetical protein
MWIEGKAASKEISRDYNVFRQSTRLTIILFPPHEIKDRSLDPEVLPFPISLP